MPQTDPALIVRVSTEAGLIRIPAAVAARSDSLRVVGGPTLPGGKTAPTKPRVKKDAATPTPSPEAPALGDDKE